MGLLGLWIRERWRAAGRDVRSFFLMRSRRRQIASLREDQKALAAELQRVYDAYKDADLTR